MRKAILISAILIAIPATAPAMMGGYGSTGGGGSSSYNGGNSVVMDQAREDLKTGLRLLAAKQYADAIPFLQRALRAIPGNVDILDYLGYADREIGNYADALDYYQRALAHNPDRKGTHAYLGELYLTMNQPDQARLQLGELVRLCPDGCVEKDALTQSIASYGAAMKPAAAGNPASPAMPPPAASPAGVAPQSPSTPGQRR
jgi:tetratricopeptide (TPR) repeat protein